MRDRLPSEGMSETV